MAADLGFRKRYPEFTDYLKVVHESLEMVEPTKLQNWVANRMQHGPIRQCIICYRGFGKTHLTNIYGTFHLGEDPQRKYLNIGSAKLKADQNNRFMLNLLKLVPAVRHLSPPESSEWRKSSVEFDVAGCIPAAAPSVMSLGITSNAVNGARATAFCCDDVESKKNSQTATMRERIRDVCRELGGAILRSEHEVEDPRAIYLGTPQVEDSIYFALIDAGYDVAIIPARYPEDDIRELYILKDGTDLLAPPIAEALRLNPELAGQPTEPERFPDHVLTKRRIEYGRRGWQLQFMLLPNLANADKYPLKINDLIVMDLDKDVAPEKLIWANDPTVKIPESELPCVGLNNDYWHSPAAVVGEYRPYTKKVMAIDPSGGGGDECAYAVVNGLNAQVFLMDVGGFRGGNSDELFMALALIAKKWEVTHVVVESNFGDGTWRQLFAPVLRQVHRQCVVEDVRVTTMKETRIRDILDPPMDAHRFIVNKSAIRNDYDSTQDYPEGTLTFQFAYQMSRLTIERGCLEHDDRLDACSLAVAQFTDHLGMDFHNSIQNRREEEFDEQLAAWNDGITSFGNPNYQRKVRTWQDH